MPQQTDAAGGRLIGSFNAQSVRLHALQERRELLTEQYQKAMSERGHVGQERMNAQARGDVAMVKEYEGVVKRIGDRMQELERTIAGVDKQIDEAMKAPVQVEEVVPAPLPGEPAVFNIAPPVDFSTFSPMSEALVAQRVKYQEMMVAEGAAFLLLGVVLWRLGMARGRRRAVPTEAPRDDRMQQAVDAIAIEVERLSEGQRFINNILSSKRPEREALPVQQRPMVEPRDGTRNTPH